MDIEQKNNIKKTEIWAITKPGFKHGMSIDRNIDNSILYVSRNLLEKFNGLNKIDPEFCKNPLGFTKLSKKLKTVFNEFDAHVFIFSKGIAVRIIAPLIKTKIEDPAIIVLDDDACHAISLLSGHIGGANKLSTTLGQITKARPVITTATNVHKQPAIHIIAVDNKMNI